MFKLLFVFLSILIQNHFANAILNQNSCATYLELSKEYNSKVLSPLHFLETIVATDTNQLYQKLFGYNYSMITRFLVDKSWGELLPFLDSNQTLKHFAESATEYGANELSGVFASLLIRKRWHELGRRDPISELKLQLELRNFALNRTTEPTFRLDARNPQEILNSGGFKPSTHKPELTIWEHIHYRSQGGRWVSISKEEISTSIYVSLLLGLKFNLGSFYQRPPQGTLRLYEYQMSSGLLGFDVPPLHGLDMESEVVVPEVSFSNIKYFREVLIDVDKSIAIAYVDPHVEIVSKSDWKSIDEF